MPLLRFLGLTLLLSLSTLTVNSAADDDGTWTYSLSGDEAIVTGCVASCPEDLVIPAIINGYNVVHIGRSAFFEYRLTSVIIPNGVRSIGYEAFANNQFGWAGTDTSCNGCLITTERIRPSPIIVRRAVYR